MQEIHAALAEDRLELHAQPIVHLATGEVVQQELLLRMRSSTGELIAPGEFLPAAERYGVIREIDRWVIAPRRRAGRRQAGAWRSTSPARRWATPG